MEALVSTPDVAEHRVRVNFFQTNGYLPVNKGQKLVTGVRNFFAQELNISKQQLDAITDRINLILWFTRAFGNGVLLFAGSKHVHQ
jgi:hypothetical protein